MRRCLIVFAREPRRGRVKTRLQKYLSEINCLNLYKAFLRDTIGLAKKVDCEIKILAYASENRKPEYLKGIAPFFIFHKQQGRNLGQKMHNAFKFAAKNEASKITIIGSDSPILTSGYIKKAFNKLAESDVVLGPTYDGGYYLIGLKKPCIDIFKDVEWSTNKALKDTVANARRLKKKICLLDKCYDVDNVESLNLLKKDLERSGNKDIALYTKKFLNARNVKRFE